MRRCLGTMRSFLFCISKVSSYSPNHVPQCLIDLDPLLWIQTKPMPYLDSYSSCWLLHSYHTHSLKQMSIPTEGCFSRPSPAVVPPISGPCACWVPVGLSTPSYLSASLHISQPISLPPTAYKPTIPIRRNCNNCSNTLILLEPSPTQGILWFPSVWGRVK